ncbi:unnamed protein product [Auanema sp. JU1783]|nr:unnamed protein product [Auanema sp. JU1783]
MQRKLTIGVICLGGFKFCGLGIPGFCLACCLLLGVGNPIVSRICFISLSLYAFLESCAVLMSIKEYRETVFKSVGIVTPSSYHTPKVSIVIKTVGERPANP